MSRIDYSKWDNLEVSDSDNESPAAPRVTRLDRPSRITTQSDGSLLIQRPEESTQASEESSVPAASTTTTISTIHEKSPNDNNNSKTTITRTNEPPASWTERGGHTTIVVTDQNTKHDVYWSQDRYSVTIRIELPHDDKSNTTMIKNVYVKGVLPYADRYCATGSSVARLVVERKRQEEDSDDVAAVVWWQDDLPHKVHRVQDDDDDDMVDWSIERQQLSQQQRPFLTMVLYKAVPCEGVTLWWKRPFKQCPDEIDLSWRSPSTVGGSSSSSSAFQQAWEEAHTQFQANVQQTKQQREV